MSETNNKLFLTKDDVRLLRYSNLITHSPDLEKVISQKDSLSLKELYLLDPTTQNMLLHDLGTFKESLYGEWEPVREGNGIKGFDSLEEGYDYIRCSVCNNPGCRYLYFIINKINGREIYVGSSCINLYIDIGLSGEKKMDYLKRQDAMLKKLKNTSEFNRVYPGAIKDVKQWFDDYNNLSLVMPPEIDRQFTLCYKKANRIIERVQAESVTADTVTQFAAILEDYKEVKDSIDRYLAENKDNRFALTNKIADWVKRKDIKLYKKLLNTCIISKEEYPFIFEHDFVMQFIGEYLTVYKPLNITKIDCEFERNYLFFSYRRSNTTIKLSISMSDFFKRYSGIIFNGVKTVIFQDFINTCSLKLDDNTIAYFKEELGKKLDHMPVEIDSIYTEFNVIFFRHKSSNRYFQMPLNGCFTNYKGFILFDDMEFGSLMRLKEMISNLLMSNKWISKSDYEHITKQYDKTLQTKEFI